MPDPTSVLEERRFDLDAEIKRRELDLREAEARKGAGLSAAQASLAGAVLALLSGVAGAGISSWTTRDVETDRTLMSLEIEKLKVEGTIELEKQKQAATESLERKRFETALILDAIKTPQRSDAIRNLKFFVAAGFVTDADGRISQLSDENLPSIAGPSAESTNRALQSTGTVRVGGAMVCNGAFISPTIAVTAGVCVDPDSRPGGGAEVSFGIGDDAYPASVLDLNTETNMALLLVAAPGGAKAYLNRSLIRDPVVGETVYMAVRDTSDAVRISTCKITDRRSEAGLAMQATDFTHDCTSEPGSAGAVIVAASDDALLGIHHSATGEGIEIGARLSAVVNTWSFHLADPQKQQAQQSAPQVGVWPR